MPGDGREPRGDRLLRYAAWVVALLGSLLLGYVGLRWLLPAVLPFLLSWTLAFAVRPPADRAAAALHLPYRPLRAVLAVLLFLTVVGALVLLGVRLAGEAWSFLSGLSGSETLDRVLLLLADPLGSLHGQGSGRELPAAVGQALQGAIGAVMSAVGGWITGVVAAVPQLVLFALITLIATVYFAVDLEGINRRVRGLLPARAVHRAVRFKQDTLSVLLRYARAYLLLMLLSFAVVLLGLVILRVPYALLIALVIALLDILPVIGVGTVLVPWSLCQLLMGDVRLGIGLLILFAVHEVIRQFAEPRILGRHLGMHPLLTLLLLYAGYTLLGLSGLLLIPLFAVLLHALLPRTGDEDGERTDGGVR